MDEAVAEAINILISNHQEEYLRIFRDIKREIRVHGGILRWLLIWEVGRMIKECNECGIDIENPNLEGHYYYCGKCSLERNIYWLKKEINDLERIRKEKRNKSKESQEFFDKRISHYENLLKNFKESLNKLKNYDEKVSTLVYNG